jgi:hypothetical protein
VLGLLGPNGAGKTTAVRILATLVKPDAGMARVHGHDVVAQAARVRRLIALTGQYSAVDEDLTGTENLVLIARLLRLPRERARRAAAELLERFELSEAAGRSVRTFSGGMRRRLDLAASLIVGELVGAAPSVDAERGLVTAAVDDTALLPAAVRRLDDAGVATAELALRLPSLDEVFLAITGRPGAAAEGGRARAAGGAGADAESRSIA